MQTDTILIFASLILDISRNPILKKNLFEAAILGFALTKAIALFAPIVVLSILFI